MSDTYELTWQFPSASTEDVFDAWVVPEKIKGWMYTGDTNDIVQVITNPITGGEFCVLKEDREQELVDYCGTYHELVRPNLLSFSLESPLRYRGTSSVVIRFTVEGEACRMAFLQTGIDPALVGVSWPKMFGRLPALLASSAHSLPGANSIG